MRGFFFLYSQTLGIFRERGAGMNQEQTINEIAVKMGRMELMQETNARNIGELSSNVGRLVDKLENSDDIAKEALQYAKAGQHQINELKESNRWLWRTFAAALITGLIGGLIAILFKVLSP
ncbi:hypothetical protein EBB07_33715 [Paenibacillaceae bacterium]|nr:hypothetical protein EBB07_33715 [Paenibacillaceae bacterium]